MAGEGFPVTLTERWRSTGIQATRPHGVQKVPHIEARPDIVPGMEFAARAERSRSFLYHFRRQGDVARDHQVTRFDSPHDFIVRDVEAGSDLKHPDDGRWRHAHGLVSYQGQGNARPLCCPEQNLFYNPRTSVGIDPDFQSLSPYWNT